MTNDEHARWAGGMDPTAPTFWTAPITPSTPPSIIQVLMSDDWIGTTDAPGVPTDTLTRPGNLRRPARGGDHYRLLFLAWRYAVTAWPEYISDSWKLTPYSAHAYVHGLAQHEVWRLAPEHVNRADGVVWTWWGTPALDEWNLSPSDYHSDGDDPDWIVVHAPGGHCVSVDHLDVLAFITAKVRQALNEGTTP